MDQTNANDGNTPEPEGETNQEAVTDQDKDDGSKEIEIPEEYKIAKEFYDKLANAEFVANGRKARVIMDPDKIIQMHQYGFGFHEKNREFNKYRPILKVLDENGFIENPDKLNYAIELLNGNKDAVKKLIKDVNLDVYEEYDPEEKIEYAPNNYVQQNEGSVIDEAFDIARLQGYDDKLYHLLDREFDDQSLKTFAEDPTVRADIMNHLATGLYDKVASKVAEMEMYDTTGAFRQAPYINKYATAYEAMMAEQQQAQMQPQQQGRYADEMARIEAERQRIEEEKRKLEEERKEAQYEAEARKRQAEIDAQRKAAANLSRPKKVVSEGGKDHTDVLNMKPGEFDEFLDKFLAGEVDI